MRFFGYVIFAYEIKIEDEKIVAVKEWSKSKLICNIQLFISFTNVYWQIINNINWIAVLLIPMLKITT